MTGPITMKANQYEGNYALNMNNSDIINVNTIKTSDLSDSWNEGFLFARTNGNWDSFRATDGNFYFSVNSGTNIATLNNDGLYLTGSNGWIRTYGSCGWYSQSHGGGWYMEDDYWIRSYGNKYVYINTNLASEHIYAGGGSYNSSYPLYVNGTMYATGDVTAASDERKKDFVEDAILTAEQIAEAPAVKFTWKDRRDENVHAGTYAQYWQKVLPEVVTDKDDSLGLNYGAAAMVSSINLAREVVELRKMVLELKEEVERLKKGGAA